MAKTKVPGGYIDDGSITSSHLHSSHGITTNDIGEHTNNKYYTDARVDTRLAASKSTNIVTTGDIQITSDTGKAKFGTGADLQIYHNGTDSVIDNITGDLYITNKADDKDIIFRSDDGSGGFTEYLRLDGSNTNMAVSKTMVFADSVKASFGAAEDLRIKHDSNNSFIEHYNTSGYFAVKNARAGGSLFLHGDAVHFRSYTGNESMVQALLNGAVTLYYDNAAKLATASDGVDITGQLDVSGNMTVGGNLTVTGTTTTVNTVTMNAQNAVVFEGATADDYETTLTIIDPTADRTINLPNQSGTIPVLAAASNTAITATPAELNYVDGVTSAIQTQLNAKQATISSSTDLTLSSIVATSSNESRFTALSIGPDADIYLYESATNAFTIRTGTSGAYKYFTFAADGKLNLASDGLQIGGTEVISGGRNLSNIGTGTFSGDVVIGSSTPSGTHALKVYHTDNYEAAKFQTNQLGSLARFTDTTASVEFGVQNGIPVIRTGSTARFSISGADVRVNSGALQMGTTTVIDSSRNLTNIGTGTFNGAVTMNSTLNVASTIGIAGTTVIDGSRNLTNIGTYTGSGNLTAGNVQLTSTGSIELFRSNGAFIDFKDSNSDDFDSRIMGGNSLIFTVGGAGSTVTGLTLGSGSATFNGDIITTKAGGDLQFNGGSTGYVKSTTGLELDFDSDNNQSGMNFKITHNGGTELFKISNSGAIRFNQAYSFPTADGSANQVLQTDGSGNLSFATVSSGGSGFSTITEPSAGQIKIGAQSGANEGGEILLENAAANGGGSYTTDIFLDNYQNQLRVHAAGSVLFSTATGTGNTTVGGTLTSGDIFIEDSVTPKLTLKDTGNAGGGAATAKIVFANTAGDAIGIGYTSNIQTDSDLIISTNAGGTYGGYLGLAANGITDAQSDIILEPKTNVRIATGSLEMGTTAFVDQSRNVTAATGTFSGNITASSKILLSSTHSKQKIEVYGGGHEWIGTSGSTLELSGANINFNGAQGSGSPVLKHGGTNIMDTNKNLVNIGTIGTTGTVTTDVSGGTDNYYYYGKESGTIRYSVYENSNNVYINTWGGMYLRANQHGGSGGGLGASGAVFNAANGVSIGTYASTSGGSANGRLQLYGSTANKQADLYCSNGNLHIDADDGNGIYLNWYGSQSATSTAGTYFGNANAGQVARIDGSGNLTLSGTVDGVDIAARNSVLTSTTTTANAALPKAGGTMTGNLILDSGTSTLLTVRCDNGGNAIVRAGGQGQGTGVFEVSQDDGSHGGGMSYNGDGSPAFVSGESNDHVTFYRINAGTRSEVFHYPYSSDTVNFNGNITLGGTVDGRDVAADGTKLDGIAANANNYSFPYTISDNAGNSSVVRRTANGYIYANYLNTTANDVSSGVSRVMVETGGDNFIRHGTAGAVRTFLNVADGANNYSFPYTVSSSAGNSSVVQRTGNGYIFANYFNTTANDVSSGVTKVMVETGNDNYIRHGDTAAIQTFINAAENGASTIHKLASNGYSQIQNWQNVGGTGLYSTTANSGHFLINQNTSYGTWRSTGSRGGYDGLVLDGGGGVAFMTDSGGNGGIYRQASSRWYMYHHVGNNCTGFSNSTTSSSYSVYVSGALYATGDIVGSSDERLKTEIKTIPNALDKVLQLRGVTYKWKDTTEGGTCVNNITETRMGVIAQEVEPILPEVVTHDKENDRYGVSYGHLTGVLIEAVKELKQEVNELKKELEEVKNG